MLHRSTLLFGAAVFTLLWGWSPAAEACGGLFCSNAAPVVQTDENIIFVDHDDGTVSAVVQIFYQGPSENFSWVLPVPGTPDIAISSNQAFTDLRSATEPVYRLNRRVIGACGEPASPFIGCGSALAAGGDDAIQRLPEEGDGDLNSLGVQQGDVGPYDYTLLTPSPDLEDPVDVALDWLDDNGYDVRGTDADKLRPYLQDGMNLLAFKLQKTSESGDIRPVILRYQTENPMVPIIPTAVAAQPGMGVRTYIVADGRAIPQNYRALELNDARINWFDPESGYRNLIDDAADEAGGHGFVTELSRPSNFYREAVFSQADEDTWRGIVEGGGDTATTLDTIARTYTTWDGLLDTVRDLYDRTDNQAVRNFLNCVECERQLANSVTRDQLIAAIDENVIEPMRATQALLLDAPQLTRLFTTMSPEEMDEDPVFDFNPDRPDVVRTHEALQLVQCHLGIYEWEAPWNIVLPSGFEIKGAGQNWPRVQDLPANRFILQEFPDAAPEIIEDLGPQIEAGLVAINGDAAPSSNGTGNRQVAVATEGGLLVFALVLGNFALRRRRKML